MTRNAAVPIGVVTNPNSKKNRALRDRKDKLQGIVRDLGIVRETRSVGEIRPTVEEFLDRGVRYWVSDGGDGALHWLVNEAWTTLGARPETRGLSLPCTIPTNGGTIDFVAKKVGIRGQAEDILDRLVRAEERGERYPEVDVPSFIFSGVQRDEATGEERPFERLGFCGAIAGIGQRFFDKYYLDPLPGPTTIVKVIAKGVASLALDAPVVSLLPGIPDAWRQYGWDLITPVAARVRVDGRELPFDRFNALHVGSIFADIGGVVRLFPFAGDGKLHVMAGNPGPLGVVTNLRHLFFGTPMQHRDLVDVPATKLEVEAMGGELLSPCLDGEIFRGIVSATIVPGPRIRVPRIDASRS